MALQVYPKEPSTHGNRFLSIRPHHDDISPILQSLVSLQIKTRTPGIAVEKQRFFIFSRGRRLGSKSGGNLYYMISIHGDIEIDAI